MKLKKHKNCLKGNVLHQATDPEAFAEFLTASGFPVNIEVLNRQSFSFDYELASTDSITFAKSKLEGDLLWKTPIESRGEKFLIFLPSVGDTLMSTGQGEVHSMPGRATIVDWRRIEGARLRGPRRHVAMYIEESKLVGRLASMLERPIHGSLDIHHNVNLTTGPGQVLNHLFEAAFAGVAGNAALRQSPLALTNLCETLICLILETIPHRFSEELLDPVAGATPRHVAIAIDFMHAHLAHPILLDDVTTAANVSERTLQEGFKRFKKTTPMAYLQRLRLQAAHGEFLEQGSKLTIAGVALKWGFVHLGRFSAAYRAAYGEYPSETVRRSTQKRGGKSSL
ncbi:AraC family transcriptional regulator [Agrobacterium rhizogenes]|uniref:AraC family transcriptional regulator n=1 Tax=Rhizobium rhizogenes TaxID=359 RepID=UPI00157173A8|nr:helix-turn-helix transcriptional regulator [Rhizobium rhizogenes]NTH16750.1 AraC family transcriptional regulator [Rhizobium rhizogenes]